MPWRARTGCAAHTGTAAAISRRASVRRIHSILLCGSDEDTAASLLATIPDLREAIDAAITGDVGREIGLASALTHVLRIEPKKSFI